MAKNNNNFHTARTTKNDEFYTQYSDIQNEMNYYRDFFKGKVVYCNCDDATESNFFKYFKANFDIHEGGLPGTFKGLGLKKLICTGYKPGSHGVVKIYEGDKNSNGIADDDEITVTELQGDGDFRSEECIEFLKEADVVVTNPPFSLFREYVAQLMEYNKKFLIIGSMGAVIYKEIFPLFMNNKVWYGVNGVKSFRQADNSIKVFGNICWFTNLEHNKRHEELDFYKRYSPEEYPKYDGSDVINVNKISDIPMDYYGVMGVPITFLGKYNPDQFEILGDANSARKLGDASCLTIINGKKIYDRLFIRRK